MTPPRATGGAVCYSVVRVQYGIESGGGQALCGDSAPFVTPPRFRQLSVTRFALLTALSLTNAAFRQLAAQPGETEPPSPC